MPLKNFFTFLTLSIVAALSVAPPMDYSSIISQAKETVKKYLADTDWTLQKQQNGIDVYSKQSDHYGGKIYKVDVNEIPGTPAQIIDYLYPTDTPKRKTWDNNVKENHVLKKVDEQTDIIYTMTHPVKAAFIELVSSRDFVDLAFMMKSQGRIQTIATSVEANDIKQPVSGVIRGFNHPNTLILEQIQSDPPKTKATQIMHAELKGNLPLWVIDSAVAGNAVSSFEAVRSQMKKNSK